MRDDFGERRLADEAQIARARGRLDGNKARDVVRRMKVDLLLPETQRRTALAKGHDLHPEPPRVEIAGASDIGDRQDEMVQARDLHGRPRNRIEALSLPRARRRGQAGRSLAPPAL